MQIPGQNAEAPVRRQISRRENAMKLCLRTISVNDEKRFSGLADRRTIEGGAGPRGAGVPEVIQSMQENTEYMNGGTLWRRRPVHGESSPAGQRPTPERRGGSCAGPRARGLRGWSGWSVTCSTFGRFTTPFSGPLPAHWILPSRETVLLSRWASRPPRPPTARGAESRELEAIEVLSV